MEDNILEVRDLRTHFIGKNGKQVRAVDGLSYSVKRGEFTAIIGESGSGKTVGALSDTRSMKEIVSGIPKEYDRDAIAEWAKIYEQ